MRPTSALLALLLSTLVVGLSGCACMCMPDEEEKASSSKKKKSRSKKKKKKSSKKSKKSSKKSAKSKAKSTKTPPKTNWTNHYELRLEGMSEAKATFFLRGGNTNGKAPMFINAYFNNFPDGTEFKVGTDEASANTSGYATLDVDMRPMAGAIKVDDIQNAKVDLGLKIVIDMPGYKPINEKLPPQTAKSAVGAMLAQVRDKPVTFTGEPKDTGRKPAMAMVEGETSMSSFKVLGPAERVWDIDLVGISTKQESDRTRLCKGYDKAPEGVTIKMVDAKVELYDRRSGDLLTESVVKARNACPSFVMINRDDMSAKTYASTRNIESWFRKTMRTHGKR
ncbi:MAG: hypothetical protein AAFX99_20505 [Myxococcota bacterium]